MGLVVLLVVTVVALVGLIAFFRAVFGGSGLPRERRRDRTRRPNDDDAGRGPRPDVHAGNTRWTGGGGLGTWNTWSTNDPGGGSS